MSSPFLISVIARLQFSKIVSTAWSRNMKAKVSLATILSTAAIASGILLTDVNSAQSCSRGYRTSSAQTSGGNWLQSPWVAVLTLPGIALAVSLYVRGRSYQN